MAVRVRSRFHTAGRERSPAELASVITMLGWKLAIDSIKRMREAHYDIDIGRPYFDFVCEFMVFVAHAADRIAHARLDSERRVAFTTALVTRMSEVVEDNRAMRLDALPPASSADHFIALFNRRGEEYAACDYDPSDGPDFGFRRVFAAGMQALLPDKDRLWAIDQVMDIEVPEAVKAISRSLGGLFAPDDAPRRRGGESGSE